MTIIQDDKIGNYPIHWAAKTYPLMDLEGKEFAAFVADIRRDNGPQEKIVRYAGPVEKDKGKIIDGRHRLIALLMLGIDPEPFIEDKIIPDPLAYVISANEHRRHLTRKQRRQRIIERLKNDVNESDHQIAKATGASQPTVSEIRRELVAAGVIQQVASTRGADGRVRRTNRKVLSVDERSGAAEEDKPVEEDKPAENPAAAIDPAAVVDQWIGAATGVSPEEVKRAGEEAEEEEAAAKRARSQSSPRGIASRAARGAKAAEKRKQQEARDGVGPDSAAEIKRKLARLDELHAENWRLTQQNLALTSQVGELQAERDDLRMKLAEVADLIGLRRSELHLQIEGLRTALKEVLKEGSTADKADESNGNGKRARRGGRKKGR